MSLTTYLNRKITKIDDSDPGWRHFLKDFRDNLLKKCTVLEINSYSGRIFRYRLRDFLYESKIPLDITWIIVWLNNMESETNFKNMNSLLIPNYTEIERIRNLYDASKQ